MKYYIKFLEKTDSGNIVEALATDSICGLDGRLNIFNMKLRAMRRLYTLKYVQKNYIGFKIMKNDIELDKVVFRDRKELESSYYYRKSIMG